MGDEEGNKFKCPFCGSTNVMIGRDIDTSKWYMICFDCGISSLDCEEKKKENKKYVRSK